MKRIILTGGGTGGHTYPLVEIAKKLQKNSRVKILYVGSHSGPEEKITRDAKIPFKAILVGKRRNYYSLDNFFDLFKIIIGLVQARILFYRFRPNLVLAKGGYVTVPIIFWAKQFKVPLIIHESDIVMGRTNLWAAKYANKICLGFPLKYFSMHNLDSLRRAKTKIPLENLIYTGTPIRGEFFSTASVHKNNPPKILFTGGSQGASKINDLVAEILSELVKKYEIYHICGNKDFPYLSKRFKNEKRYHLYDFSQSMPELLKNSDLIITRSGANILSEISALGKPSILIPLRNSSKDHQRVNAKLYQDSNSAIMLSENNLTSSSLLSIINRLMEDDQLRKLLGHHAQEFSVRNSAAIITDLIYELI